MVALYVLWVTLMLWLQVSIVYLGKEARRYINLKYASEPLAYALRNKTVKRTLFWLTAIVQLLIIVPGVIFYITL